MSAATETIAFLAKYNSWRRGDETIEMPSPAEIGATIDDAVNLLRKYDDLKARAERAEAELADEAIALRDMMSERDKAEAELAAERARLGWLELRGPWESWNGFGETGITLRENIRATIDAAMNLLTRQ